MKAIRIFNEVSNIEDVCWCPKHSLICAAAVGVIIDASNDVYFDSRNARVPKSEAGATTASEKVYHRHPKWPVQGSCSCRHMLSRIGHVPRSCEEKTSAVSRAEMSSTEERQASVPAFGATSFIAIVDRTSSRLFGVEFVSNLTAALSRPPLARLPFIE